MQHFIFVLRETRISIEVHDQESPRRIRLTLEEFGMHPEDWKAAEDSLNFEAATDVHWRNMIKAPANFGEGQQPVLWQPETFDHNVGEVHVHCAMIAMLPPAAPAQPFGNSGVLCTHGVVVEFSVDQEVVARIGLLGQLGPGADKNTTTCLMLFEDMQGLLTLASA